MKIKLLTIIAVIIVVCFGQAYSQSISLEAVDGLYAPDTLLADDATPIVFSLRVTGDVNNHNGANNGFRVYSEDGATWGGTIPDTLTVSPIWKSMFDLLFSTFSVNTDGILSDTVAFGGASGIIGTGLVANFDAVAYSITIGPLNKADHKKSICLDSSWYPPTGTWKWAGITIIPAWDGPHCFTLFDPTADVSAINGSGLPTDFALSQNYPNPFNPTTTINFDLPTKTDVRIKVFNVLGQVVNTLVDQTLEAGSYKVDWDGTNQAGAHAASGVYFYRIVAGDFVETKKMMMLK